MKRITFGIAGALLTLAVVTPSNATLNKCASAKQLCVAKRTAALLKCHSKNTKPPGIDPAKFAACVQKAEDKFDGGADPSNGCFAKVEAKYGIDCLTAGDTGALAATVDVFVDDVVCQLDPAGDTCPNCTDGIENELETDIDCGGPDCGDCGLGQGCAGPSDCVTGTCAGNACVCAAGTADCNVVAGDACEVTLATNTSHCGACNNACTTMNGTPACVASQCQIGSCNSGFGNCNGNVVDGCEQNLTSSIANCGACGNVCSSLNGTPSCVASQCQIVCSGSFKNCDNNPANGCEVNSNTDENHCGTCGNVCLPGQSCMAGSCV